MFSEDKSKVLLILKDRPEWQKGKLNGIGGKNEIDKDSIYMDQTQVREFLEETGIETKKDDWDLFAIISGTETKDSVGTELNSTYRVYCFRSFSDKIFKYKHIEIEKPIICNVQDIIMGLHKILPNVNWLIPMALNHKGSILEIQYN